MRLGQEVRGAEPGIKVIIIDSRTMGAVPDENIGTALLHKVHDVPGGGGESGQKQN